MQSGAWRPGIVGSSKVVVDAGGRGVGAVGNSKRGGGVWDSRLVVHLLCNARDLLSLTDGISWDECPAATYALHSIAVLCWYKHGEVYWCNSPPVPVAAHCNGHPGILLKGSQWHLARALAPQVLSHTCTATERHPAHRCDKQHASFPGLLVSLDPSALAPPPPRPGECASVTAIPNTHTRRLIRRSLSSSEPTARRNETRAAAVRCRRPPPAVADSSRRCEERPSTPVSVET